MAATSSDDAAAPARSLRVMVVEDEALVAMLVEDELLDAGATVLGTATSVAEVLRMLNVAMADGGMDACST